MSLSEFILRNVDTILQEWGIFANTLVPEKVKFNQEILLDHAKRMLEAIAEDLALPESPFEQAEKSQGRGIAKLAQKTKETAAMLHGMSRLHYGFSLPAAISEYRALRASVTRLWEQLPENRPMHPASVTDLIRFNEAIDQALTESVTAYYLEQEQKGRMFNAILSSTPDLSYTFDLAGNFTYANKAFLDLVGMHLPELLQKNYRELHLPNAEENDRQVQRAIQSKQHVRGEVKLMSSLGREAIYENIFVPVCNTDGSVEAVVGTSRNITERKTQEIRNWKQANFDPLTGLPNRSLFLDRLEQEVRHAVRSGVPIALLFVDLDKFKEVNDKFGHEAGDQLLQSASERMRACLRESDTVARLGGDEFTIILQDLGESGHVEYVAEKMRMQMQQPFLLQQQEVSISVSIGIALAPSDAKTRDALIKHADEAMYRSKQAGGNHYSFFSTHQI